MSSLPPGWYLTTIGESARFLTGYPFESARFSREGIRLLRGSNVKRATIDWSADIAKYWPRAEPSLRSYELEDDDIVIAMDGALVGRSFARLTTHDLPAYLVQRVARLRGTNVDQGLLYGLVGSDKFVRHVDSVKTHTAIPHISPRDITDFSIAVPGNPIEQRRIAETLSDADRQIAALDRMLTKKEDIKQGIAQELLTARKRLRGFSGSWQSRRLSELLSYEQPTPYLVSNTDYVGSGTPVLTAGKTFVLGHTDDQHGIYRALPVIIFDDFTTASKLVTFPFKAKSSAMKVLRARPGTNLRFVYERMQLINFRAVDHKRRWISEYSKLQVSVPEEVEQIAIAHVLADLDADITALVRLLTKAKATKEGIAQQLLAGRIRLPDLEPVA